MEYVIILWLLYEIAFFTEKNDLMLYAYTAPASDTGLIMRIIICYFVLFVLFFPVEGFAIIHAGIGKADITPPIGTPSAGYVERHGEGMQGVHDPLLAIALFICNGDKQIVLCSVDHLGFTYEMVQEIIHKVHSDKELSGCEIYIGSSHTHSGGGAYLNMPILGEQLAGVYNSDTTRFYIEQTTQSILQAYQNRTSAKLGISYGTVEGISRYRGLWPKDLLPVEGITLIKVTDQDDAPLALLFNYAVHPTVLPSENRLFSADFVGYVRDQLRAEFGKNVQPLFFNGAQGDIIPVIFNEHDRYDACARLAKSLSSTIKQLWSRTEVSDCLHIATYKDSYSFMPQATPFGLILPIESYDTEMNAIILNHSHAFMTIPGELSTAYDRRLKKVGERLGFAHVSILGLTNDAHGYILLPETWRYKTVESGLSFGGENYGDLVEQRAILLLQKGVGH